MARSFLNNGISFGWKDVEAIYLRDEDRLKNGQAKRNLVKHAILLEKYTTMNAAYAIQPFSEKTI